MDSELDEMTGVTLDEGMRAVLEVARALAVITSRDELLDRIVRTCAEGLGFGSASVAILDEDGRLRLKAIASQRGDLTLDAMAGYSLALKDLETLLGIATRIGDLYWVDGREPFLAELEARGAIVATTPSVPSSEWHPRSLLMAPLYRPGNEIFGVVFSDDPLDGRIPDSSRAILISALAHFASLTIQMHESRSYADAQLRILRAQRQRLEDLFRASSEVQRAQRLEEVLQTSADAVTHAGGFKRAAIYLRSGDRLELRVTSGVEPDDRAKLVAHGSIELASFSALMQPQSRISRSYLFKKQKIITKLNYK
jgi:GAF domain-containing protein